MLRFVHLDIRRVLPLHRLLPFGGPRPVYVAVRYRARCLEPSKGRPAFIAWLYGYPGVAGALEGMLVGLAGFLEGAVVVVSG